MKLDDLMAAGAEVVGGNVYYKRTLVGMFRDGGFIPTEQGMKIQLPETAEPAAEKPSKKKRPQPDAVLDELDNLDV